MRDKDQKEIASTLRRIADAAHRRGHASMFAMPKDDENFGEDPGHWQRVLERVVAQDWADSVPPEWGISATGITSNPDDPPDCLAKMDDQVIGIELTELVKGEIIRKHRRHEEGKRIYSPAERFEDETWSREAFASMISDRLRSKNAKAIKKRCQFDILVLYTDELDLSPDKIEVWLRDLKFEPTSHIKRAFLLLSYWPGYRLSYPVFELSIR